MNENDPATCVFFGAGGHAQVLIDCLQSTQALGPLVILDRNSKLWKTYLLGIPILGDDSLIPELIQSGAILFSVAVGSTGDSRPRRRLFELGHAHGLSPMIIIHRSAIISRWAAVSPGAQILPGVIVNAGARIGFNTIINSGAIVEHDCTIGDHAHVATGARLAGAVRVEPGAHIGVGATVREGLCIGEGAIVGAGAVVVKHVDPYTVVAGVPARKMRTLDYASAEGTPAADSLHNT